jgi:hypothetical protein
MSAIDDLITAFRKETEDMVMTMIRDMFNYQYGEIAVSEGVTSNISLSVAYDSANDYEVAIFSALDGAGTDIVDALTITKVGPNGFTIDTDRSGNVRWETVRRTPKISFFTND